MSYKSVRQQLLIIAVQPLPEGKDTTPTLESKVAGARRITLEPPPKQIKEGIMYMGNMDEPPRWYPNNPSLYSKAKVLVLRGWAEAQMFTAKLQGG